MWIKSEYIFLLTPSSWALWVARTVRTRVLINSILPLYSRSQGGKPGIVSRQAGHPAAIRAQGEGCHRALGFAFTWKCLSTVKKFLCQCQGPESICTSPCGPFLKIAIQTRSIVGLWKPQFLQAADYCSYIKGLMKVNRAQKMNAGVECGSILGTRGDTDKVHTRKMSPIENGEKKKQKTKPTSYTVEFQQCRGKSTWCSLSNLYYSRSCLSVLISILEGEGFY